MLVIAHRGAVGSALENTLEAFQAAVDAGADMIEFDVRETRDGELVIIHDSTLRRTHGINLRIRSSTLQEIRDATALNRPIVALKEMLDRYFGVILLNLEIKDRKMAAKIIHLTTKYIHKNADWNNIIFSSFNTRDLVFLRRRTPDARLALLHRYNPFRFIAHVKRLQLSAVGFHYRNTNGFALSIAQKAGLFTYLYTVNDNPGIVSAKTRNLDGAITDHPSDARSWLDDIL